MPSLGALAFGQINTTSGAFTSISQLPSGLALPLEVAASNPISGEYYFGANPRSALEMVRRTISFARPARTGPHPAHPTKSLRRGVQSSSNLL
jgi:hypothetical protein